MSEVNKPDEQIKKKEARIGRRDYLKIRAIEPVHGKDCEVLISIDRVERVGRRSRGQTMEAAFIVPEILQNPKAIFEGVRREEDERGSNSPGWRCYSGIPSKGYVKSGKEVPPWPGEVFLVFVNAENVAYLWYWSECSKDDPNVPIDCETRFRERKL